MTQIRVQTQDNSLVDEVIDVKWAIRLGRLGFRVTTGVMGS